MSSSSDRRDRTSLSSFVESTPWGMTLLPADRERVLETMRDETFVKGQTLVRVNDFALYWVGVVQGMVAQSVTQSDGYMSFLSAVGDGAWFGEGTLIKRARWGYDAVALQDTRAVLLPLETFEWLRATSIPFNHFLQHQMNARLATYIGTILSARHASTEARVATALINLLSAGGASGAGDRLQLRLSQSELAMLAGTSRQRVNDVLKRLASLGVVRPLRNGVAVLDPEALSAIAGTR